MHILVCIDDDGGLLFNHRRQSRDRQVISDMINTTKQAETCLWIDPFSEKLLAAQSEEAVCPLQIAEDFLSRAAEEDYCFVENAALKEYEDRIRSVTVYRWNRKYPADTFFDLDLTLWQKESSTDMAGSSHERITKEVYRK